MDERKKYQVSLGSVLDYQMDGFDHTVVFDEFTQAKEFALDAFQGVTRSGWRMYGWPSLSFCPSWARAAICNAFSIDAMISPGTRLDRTHNDSGWSSASIGTELGYYVGTQVAH